MIKKEERIEIRKIEFERMMASLTELLRENGWGDSKEDNYTANMVIPELNEIWSLCLRRRVMPDVMRRSINE